ncbi:MAG: serine/threonine-protein kinase [Thermoguttaceae bacterium]
MSNLPKDQGVLTSLSAAQRIDLVCEQFEAAWKAGSEPRIEDYANADWAADPAVQRQLLAELILVDLEFRWGKTKSDTLKSARPQEETFPIEPGLPQRPLLADYLARYPALGNPNEWPVDLIVREYWVRQQWGDRPGHAEYLRRYPEHAAELGPRLADVDQAIARQAAAASPAAAESSLPPIGLSLDEFAQQITRSALLTPEQLRAFQESLPPDQRPQDADTPASALVQAGKLTVYQVSRIRDGKAKGLAFGQYVLLEPIGAGGMGQVFKARHRAMNRIVALKILSARLMDSPDLVKRFQREAQAAARLKHPNIVTAYDAGEQEDVHYLVMEYVEGEDLARIVTRQGPLPMAQAVDCIVQAARGLEYAHQHGVIHRDIKPGNLLLDQQGVVLILDMGLARLDETSTPGAGPENLTTTGQAMGTFDYMAPEQALDTHQADARSDIYSLGCTLFRLLTGRSPYPRLTIVW